MRQDSRGTCIICTGHVASVGLLQNGILQSTLTLADSTIGRQSGQIQDSHILRQANGCPSTRWAATLSWPTQPKVIIPCCRQVAAPYDLDSTAILADAVRQRLRRRVATLWADSLVFVQKGPPLQLQWQDSEAGLAAVFRRGAAAPAHISDRSAASIHCFVTNKQLQAGRRLACFADCDGRWVADEWWSDSVTSHTEAPRLSRQLCSDAAP